MKKTIFVLNIINCCISAMLILSPMSYAAHPLITDDTGTQGKGKFQVEINSEFSYDKETEEGVLTRETGRETATILSYGVTDAMDIVLGLPYQWNRSWEDGVKTSDEDGISDMSVELKWMFYENNGLSFALKPGITLPTGADERGLGAGRTAYSIFFITTKETGPFAFHLNLGYAGNENRIDERKDIWHASLASEAEASEKLRLVVNVGTESNPDKASHTDPAFILGGVIYSITDDIDIDFGLKAGLNKPETDHSILTGINFRF